MAQIMPKMKTYLFICFISIMINMIAFVMSFAINGNASLASFIGSGVGAFFPIVDIVSVAFMGFPVELLAMFVLFTGVMSAIKIWILAEIIASHVPTVNV